MIAAGFERTRSSQVVLGLLCLMYLILFVSRVSLSTAAPPMRKDLGLSNAQLGLAFSAFAIPYAAFQLIGGWIGDRLGPRFTLGLCCTIVAAATALTGAAGGFASLFGLRVALGFGEGAAFPAATGVMARWVAVERWGFAQGITHSFARIGNALTPALVAGLLAFVSWRAAFGILGSTVVLWLVAWIWYFHDDPRKGSGGLPPGLSRDQRERLPSRVESSRPKIPWMSLARRILPVTLVDFCYGWTLWLFLSWIPSFFLENYHLNLGTSALFSVGVLSAGVVGDTAGGMWSDWLLRKSRHPGWARRTVIVTGFLGAFVFLLPVMLIHNVAAAAVGLRPGILFRRTDCGAHLVRSHGRCSEICEHRQWHDELWLRRGRPGFAGKLRLSGGPDGELGDSVRWLGGAAGGGRGAGVVLTAAHYVRRTFLGASKFRDCMGPDPYQGTTCLENTLRSPRLFSSPWVKGLLHDVSVVP
jgi:sugar phosphate permease